MGGKSSKAAAPAEPVTTKGAIVTASTIFGRTASILMIVIMSVIMLVMGAMIIKMAGQSGQTGAIGCMILFGFLTAYSIYSFYNIDGQILVTSEKVRNWWTLGIFTKTKTTDNSG